MFKKLLGFTLLVFLIVLLLVLFVLPTKAFLPEILLGSADSLIYQILNKNKVPDLNITSEQECDRAGGKWESLGLIQKEQCQFYSKDANKPCTTGFQCELGSCEAPGKCAGRLLRYGCYTDLHFGTKGMGLCVD